MNNRPSDEEQRGKTEKSKKLFFSCLGPLTRRKGSREVLTVCVLTVCVCVRVCDTNNSWSRRSEEEKRRSDQIRSDQKIRSDDDGERVGDRKIRHHHCKSNALAQPQGTITIGTGSFTVLTLLPVKIRSLYGQHLPEVPQVLSF